MKNFIVSLFVLLLLLLLFVGESFAQPDLSRPLGPTIADTGSQFYRFEKFDLDSSDGERHYKITVGIPKTETPENEYPVFYMLDGNAALAVLDDDLFSWLESLPVIVAIGYNTELRFDVTSRAFDYTPALPDSSKPNDERGRKGGGSDIFAEFIETKIKPKVESFARIDRQRQTVWGHSYGGLFVLNTLFKHPEMFQNYAAADPSFWWQDGVILKIEKQFDEQIAKKGIEKNKLSLAVFVGRGAPQRNRNTEQRSRDAEQRNRERSTEPTDSSSDRSTNVRRSMPPNTAEDFVKRFEPLLKTTEFRTFEGFGHGQMLPASLEPALRFCVR
ncbi:MAG: prolyl oligopeptidase family serine peptidase [Planctomycetaceae bacterium]|jgi:predicted alpha/beta superfamily hydrolase|nr:prolyl oligopeptidase family serine peptidase [Planctomycetaceae bacterium]